ncbi:MAG: hypothetical protein U9R79_11745 [Armatimonadota bacterium]|nr:hypothetical protein [Armatimonadota bacterium]
MRIAVWSHPYREFPEGADSAQAMTDRLVELREAGVELSFPFVAVSGQVYFHSETLGAPDRELLGPYMEAAREVGVRVHPVIGLGGPVGIGRGLYEPPLDYQDVPEWAMSWPCASWGENHERTVLLANELIERYQPDGLHLDYARYPNADVLVDNPCTCPRCQQARLQWLGKPYPEPYDLRKPGVVFKELQMRIEFVRSFVESVRGLTDHHQIRLSAAVRARYYEDALVEGQDWAEWCDDGLLDIVCPMSYTLSFGSFAKLVAQHRRLLSEAQVQWLAGIGLSSSAGDLDFDALDRQIRFAAQAGAPGVCIFHAAAIGPQELSLIAKLSSL